MRCKTVEDERPKIDEMTAQEMKMIVVVMTTIESVRFSGIAVFGTVASNKSKQASAPAPMRKALIGALLGILDITRDTLVRITQSNIIKEQNRATPLREGA